MHLILKRFFIQLSPCFLGILSVFLISMSACDKPSPSTVSSSSVKEQVVEGEESTATSKEVSWDSLKDKAGSGLTEAGALWDSVKDKTGNGLTEIKEWSTGQLDKSLGEFAKVIPVIKEAGFETSEIAVTMGLIPKLSLEFKRVKVLSAEEQAKLLKLHENEKMLSYLLGSLFKVHSLQFGKYQVTAAEIALTVPPTTTVKLVPEDSL